MITRKDFILIIYIIVSLSVSVSVSISVSLAVSLSVALSLCLSVSLSSKESQPCLPDVLSRFPQANMPTVTRKLRFNFAIHCGHDAAHLVLSLRLGFSDAWVPVSQNYLEWPWLGTTRACHGPVDRDSSLLTYIQILLKISKTKPIGGPMMEANLCRCNLQTCSQTKE